jgi:hypothetical protein
MLPILTGALPGPVIYWDYIITLLTGFTDRMEEILTVLIVLGIFI